MKCLLKAGTPFTRKAIAAVALIFAAGISHATDVADDVDEIENESYSCVSLGEVKFDDRAVCMGSDKKYVLKKLKALAHDKGANAISVSQLAKCEGAAKAFDCAETFWMNESELRKTCNENQNELQAEACLDLAFEISDREDSTTERTMLYKKACALGHKSGCRAFKDAAKGLAKNSGFRAARVSAQPAKPVASSAAEAAAPAPAKVPTPSKKPETYEIQQVEPSEE
jgi:hypothetical protein